MNGCYGAVHVALKKAARRSAPRILRGLLSRNLSPPRKLAQAQCGFLPDMCSRIGKRPKVSTGLRTKRKRRRRAKMMRRRARRATLMTTKKRMTRTVGTARTRKLFRHPAAAAMCGDEQTICPKAGLCAGIARSSSALACGFPALGSALRRLLSQKLTRRDVG